MELYSTEKALCSKENHKQNEKTTHKIGALTFLKFRQIYSNQDNEVLAQDKRLDQWNSTEIPETNVHIFSQLITVKGAKTIQ